jgi:hypothetical protein
LVQPAAWGTVAGGCRASFIAFFIAMPGDHSQAPIRSSAYSFGDHSKRLFVCDTCGGSMRILDVLLLRRTPRGSEIGRSLHGGWQEVTRRS